MRGKFIALEGGEGAGKTTAARKIKEHIEGNFNMPVLLTREPGGTPFGEAVRGILLGAQYDIVPEAELMAFVAARIQHVDEVIRPALEEGTHVVCDRFDWSTYAYQIAGPERDHIKAQFWETHERWVALRPDLYILLDVFPEIGLERAAQRRGKETRFEKRDIDFHKRVRRGFLDCVSRVPSGRACVIDANKDKQRVQDIIMTNIWRTLSAQA